MKPAIHYEFIAKIIKRKKDDGEFEFIETKKEFINDEPIKAREEALEYYQNYIESMLEYLGLTFESDRQARAALESFHNPKTKTKSVFLGHEFYIPDSLGYGLGVFMVIDEIIEDKTDLPSSEFDNFKLIHGMGDLMEGSFSEESLTLSLEIEVNYYKHFNYNTSSYLTQIIFCNRDEWFEGNTEDEPETYTILKTPFDWYGMDKPYWWGEPSEEDEVHEKEPATYVKTWEEIIAGGENSQVEFKPALLYNHLSKKAGISIKGIIAKSICGFLNARGGFLFIGMNDDGTPQGLSHDYSLAEEKAPKDFFNLQFDDTIKQFLPQSIPNISGQFIAIEDIEIFVVIVFPSKTKPVFMKGQYGKEFWVRWTASTRQIVDVEEVTNYCLENWGNKT